MPSLWPARKGAVELDLAPGRVEAIHSVRKMGPAETNTLVLSDGRMLGYAGYGGPDGKPLFYFHGNPGSRLEARMVHDVATRVGVRIVAPDRPGMGLSSYDPDRTVLDWPHDVVELADALNIDRFAVLGLSSGAPYAAACAYSASDRLTGVGLVSSEAPPEAPHTGMPWTTRLLLHSPRYTPWIARIFFWLMALLARRDPEFLVRMVPTGPEREVMLRPSVAEAIRAAFLETFRSGTRGLTAEAALLARPWGFRLEEIPIEVHVWHGEQDPSPAAGRYLATVIPDCHATIYPDEGHISTLVNHAEEIFTALTGVTSQARDHNL